jgi:hypothetical protein
VRSIFSTGQVPLLEGAANTGLASSREFMVRCVAWTAVYACHVQGCMMAQYPRSCVLRNYEGGASAAVQSRSSSGSGSRYEHTCLLLLASMCAGMQQ